MTLISSTFTLDGAYHPSGAYGGASDSPVFRSWPPSPFVVSLSNHECAALTEL